MLRIERGWQAVSEEANGGRLTGGTFESTKGGEERLRVRAGLTLDASDWGDLIRLCGAACGSGPDLRSRFGEPSVPEPFDAAGEQELHPMARCLVQSSERGA